MLAAGTGLKLSDFLGYFFNFNGVLQGNKTVIFFSFFFLAFFCKIHCKLY